MSGLTTEQLRDFFAREFPQAALTIEASGPGYARIRQETSERHLRPGGTVAGPVMMAIADTATYAALLGEIGLVPLAVTTNLTINFLRKPSRHHPVVGEARILKLGKRLATAEVRIFQQSQKELVAHATVTYAIPANGRTS